MRLIGQVDSKQHAERFSAFLMTHEISAHCELENESWEIWIRDEDQIQQATELLDGFRSDPEASQYLEAVNQAQTIVREQEKKQQHAKKNVVQMQNRWNAPLTRRAPLTITLVILCVIVALLTNFGGDREGAAFRALSFCSLTEAQALELVGEDGLNPYNTKLRTGSVARGEVWRFITPIFIHFGPIHLLFNMYWLVIFGSQIEGRFGALWMATLVVLTAIPSTSFGAIVPEALDGTAIAHVGGYLTIFAGGFSGVLYGLFGYIWMKMVFDPQSGLFMTRSTVTILMVWLIVCMMPGLMESFGMSIDNWAHGVGLVTGLIIGYTPKMLSDMGFGRAKPVEK